MIDSDFIAMPSVHAAAWSRARVEATYSTELGASSTRLAASRAVAAAASITEYCNRNLPIAKNIALLLLKDDSFNPVYFSNFTVHLQTYFSQVSTKNLNFIYTDTLHSEIVGEYQRLSFFK